jgi:hypothetical protein
MGTRKKVALVLLGAGIAATAGLTFLDVLLAYVPLIAAALSSGSVYLWVTGT